LVVEGGHNQDAARPSAGRRRLTVTEAAEALGVSIEAIRGRIKRNTIEHIRDGDRVYVLVDANQPRPGRDEDTDRSADLLYSELKERIAYLERQVQEEREARRRADTLLARLMDNIPALEPPPEQPASAESAEDAPERPAHAAPVVQQGGRREEAERERDELSRRLEGARKTGGTAGPMLARGDGVERRPREGSTEPQERAGRPYWWLIASLALVLAAAVAVIAFFVVMGLLA
jgi:excisionase family DNA binding protein